MATHAVNAANPGTINRTYFEQQELRTKVAVNAVPPPASLFYTPELVHVAQVQTLALAPVIFVQPLVNQPDEILLVPDDVQSFDKQKYLKLLLIPEDGSEVKELSLVDGVLKYAPGDKNTQLDLSILNGNQLIEQFKNLPDGRYRLNLYRTLGDEILDERTVLETVISNGVPTNPVEEIIDQLRRNLDREIEADKADGADGKGAGLNIVPEVVVPVTAIDYEKNSQIKSVMKSGPSNNG